jgi:hypothetical protein
MNKMKLVEEQIFKWAFKSIRGWYQNVQDSWSSENIWKKKTGNYGKYLPGISETVYSLLFEMNLSNLSARKEIRNQTLDSVLQWNKINP